MTLLDSDRPDIAEVDVSTRSFGPEADSLAHADGSYFCDANGDRVTNLFGHFATNEAGVSHGTPKRCLTGETLGKIPFEGHAPVETVGLVIRVTPQ